MLTIKMNVSDDKKTKCMFSKYNVEVTNIPFDISTLPASSYDLENLALKDDVDLPAFSILCWCNLCTENESETWITGEIIKTSIGPKQKIMKSCESLEDIDENSDDDEDDEKCEFLDSLPVDAISIYYSKFLAYRDKWGSTDCFPKNVYLNGCYCNIICDCSFRHTNPYGSIKV
jgi:hypothetical protein